MARYWERRARWKSRRRKLASEICRQAKRRNELLRVLFMCILLLNENQDKDTPKIIRERRLIRNYGWWNKVWNVYSSKRFKKKFRISREAFKKLLSRIKPYIEKQPYSEGEPIPPEMRLGICLYRLSRGTYYDTIAEMTGVAPATVYVITMDVCRAIIEEMWESEVQKLFPTSEEEFKDAMANMDAEWQFPYAFAAIDGSHIPIKCPNGGAEAQKQYHNFKNFYSIVLLGIVDASYRFIWASAGAPGNSHDSTIFQTSDLWSNIQSGTVIPSKGQKVDGVVIPPMILGDSAFPLNTWLGKPYGDAVLTNERRYYNYRHSRARMVTEGAFGKLKSVWRVLHRKCESGKDTVKLMTLTCVVLHNFMIANGELIPRKLDLTKDLVSNKRRNQEEIRDKLDMTKCAKRPWENTNAQAKRNRNVMCEVFWREKNE